MVALMDNSIKECIKDLLTVACCPGHVESCKRVYNYITNLQQDNEMYSQLKDEYEEGIKDLQQENESLKQMSKDTYDTSQEIMSELQEELKSANDSITWWTNRFNAVQRDYEDYKSRIKKAIPMLKELNIKLKDILKSGIDIKEISDIEKVLQGVGKDE